MEVLLLGNYGEVVGVNEGYYEGYVRISTEVFGVREDRDVGRAEGGFYITEEMIRDNLMEQIAVLQHVPISPATSASNPLNTTSHSFHLLASSASSPSVATQLG